MAKRKTTTETTKERATVSKERRLALALRALLDSLTDVEISDGHGPDVTEAELLATATLKELGYENLEGIPRRLKRLETELAAATEAKDYGKVAELGRELERVRSGKAERVKAAAEVE